MHGRNHGVFEPEMRLWTLYFALPFYVAGFVLLGYCFEGERNVFVNIAFATG